jgi:hypothetical protein
MRRGTLRKRGQSPPTVVGSRRDRHLADRKGEGENRRLRLLHALGRQRGHAQNAALVIGANRKSVRSRSLIQLPRLAATPLATTPLTTAGLGRVRGNFLPRHHSAAPSGRQNNADQRNECHNSGQPEHDASIFSLGRPHKRNFQQHKDRPTGGQGHRRLSTPTQGEPSLGSCGTCEKA